jgi:hypothetical protein
MPESCLRWSQECTGLHDGKRCGAYYRNREVYQAQAPKGILRNSVCAGSAAAFSDELEGKMEIEARMSKAGDDISKQ